MSGDRSDLERRLEEVAEGLEGSSYHWDHDRAVVLREAAMAIGAARQLLRALDNFPGSVSLPVVTAKADLRTRLKGVRRGDRE